MSIPSDVDQRYEGRIRDKDQGITRNIDHFMEELRREQEAIDKRIAEYEKRRNELKSQLQIDETSLDDTEEKDEEDWEEEYVVLDLDDVFHGAPIPNSAYTLSGLDTLNPILILDNGLKLIGQYVETVGSVVVYSEKERDVVAETRELATPADPFAVNTVKKPLKRIRGVCKLERKLKFCAMPIDSAPPNHSMFMHNAGNASQMNAMPVPHVNARPVEDVVHANDRPVTEDLLCVSARPVMEDAVHVNDRAVNPVQEDAVHVNDRAVNSVEEDAVHVNDRVVNPVEDDALHLNSRLGEEDVLRVNDRPVKEDALHRNNRPVEEDVSHVNDRPVEEDALHLNNRPVEEDGLHVNDRPVEDSLHVKDTPVEQLSIQNT